MQNLKISVAQFENKNGDKTYNLSIIDKMAKQASREGSSILSFHECCITGYSFLRHLSREEMLSIAERLPQGPSIAALQHIAEKYNIILLAGLIEKDGDQNLYNTYVCVGKTGLIARHRKLHPFINSHLVAGDSYTVFDIMGWKCGILICYDNNITENVRATRLLGANILFMPHVTMCTPSSRPGAGFVDPNLWKNRTNDPTSLRLEFDGMKGREWLMKWLPSRAYDNALYAVFTNPIGMDDDQLKNGCSMIIDPFGDILSECRNLDNDFTTALITPEKLEKAGGYRYLNARRPNLYQHLLSQDHNPQLKVSWLVDEK